MKNQASDSILRLSNTIFYLISLLTLVVLFNCSGKNDMQPDEPLEPTVILISMDGFRYDYLDLVATPAFDALIESGVKAESLIPVFPSKTFPNHYSQVTGLYPVNHDLISNTIYDPQDDTWFRLGTPAVTESKWYGGEPIWVTAALQDKTTASFFWVGTEAKIKGLQPTYWKPYDGSIPNNERVAQVLAWLDLPKAERPQFISLYMSDTDDAGHGGGPGSGVVANAVAEMDLILKLLTDGIASRKLTDQVDIIIVSDHGMSQLSRDRMIFIDDYINLDEVTMVDWSPVGMIIPDESKEEAIYEALVDKNDHMRVYRKGELPDYLHYNKNRLIPPIICIADDGWSISSKEFSINRPTAYTGGTHGYDFEEKPMHGIFMATGPHFKENITGPAFQNIHLYELMCQILEITPAVNDGDPEVTAIYLK